MLRKNRLDVMLIWNTELRPLRAVIGIHLGGYVAWSAAVPDPIGPDIALKVGAGDALDAHPIVYEVKASWRNSLWINVQ